MLTVLTLPQSFYVVQLCPFFVIRKCKFVGEIPNSMRSSSMQNGRSVMYGGVRCCPAVERRCIVLSCHSTAIQFLLNLSKNKTVFTVGNGSTKGIVITLTWTKGHYDNKPCVIFIGVTKLQQNSNKTGWMPVRCYGCWLSAATGGEKTFIRIQSNSSQLKDIINNVVPK